VPGRTRSGITLRRSALNGKHPQGNALKEFAARRVEAVWACVNVLCPELSMDDRKALAAKFLDLAREGYRPPEPNRISPAQVEEIVWRNS